jgi:hypothetical protein
MSSSQINVAYIGVSIVLIVLLVYFVNYKSASLDENIPSKDVLVLTDEGTVELDPVELGSALQKIKHKILKFNKKVNLVHYNEIKPALEKATDNIKDAVQYQANMDDFMNSDFYREQDSIQRDIGTRFFANGLNEDDHYITIAEDYRKKMLDFFIVFEQLMFLLDGDNVPHKRIDMRALHNLVQVMSRSIKSSLDREDIVLEEENIQLNIKPLGDLPMMRHRRSVARGRAQKADLSQNIAMGFERYIPEGEIFVNDSETQFYGRPKMVPGRYTRPMPKSCVPQTHYEVELTPTPRMSLAKTYGLPLDSIINLSDISQETDSSGIQPLRSDYSFK